MLSVSSQRKYNFYHRNRLLDAFRTNSRNIIGRNPSMVIPLLANQDLTPMLNTCQRKIFTITNICSLNETLLRMLALDLLDKVAKRLDFHSTTILLLDFF